MKAFDYLSSLILLFTAITLGELTMGLGYSLNSGTRASFYLPHMLFVIATFFGSVDYTLRIYTLRKVQEWQFWSLIIVLIPGLVWLLGTKFLFPEIDPPARYDFREIFQSNRLLIYSMIIAYGVSVNAAFAIVYKVNHVSKIIIFGLFLILFVVGIVVENEALDYLLGTSSVLFTLINSYWKKARIKSEA